jgi:hypothetical protein
VKNIQPQKDKVHPAYLYTGVRDPSRVTNRRITEENALSRAELMLKVVFVRGGAHRSYSACNLPPSVSLITLIMQSSS